MWHQNASLAEIFGTCPRNFMHEADTSLTSPQSQPCKKEELRKLEEFVTEVTKEKRSQRMWRTREPNVILPLPWGSLCVTVPLSSWPKRKKGGKRDKDGRNSFPRPLRMPFWRNYSDILDLVSGRSVTQEQNEWFGAEEAENRCAAWCRSAAESRLS